VARRQRLRVRLETAAKLTDNLSGDVERLKGSFETLAIQSGGGANSGLRLFAKGLNAIVNQIGAMSPATSGTLVVLAGLTGVLLVGGAAWVKYRKFVAEAQAQLIATGPAGEKAAVGLGKVTSVLGKVGLWAAAAEAATTLFNSLDQKSVDVDRLTASLENLEKTGQSAGALNEDFGKNFDKLGRIAQFADSANRRVRPLRERGRRHPHGSSVTPARRSATSAPGSSPGPTSTPPRSRWRGSTRR
jgi:hypothetical protein